MLLYLSLYSLEINIFLSRERNELSYKISTHSVVCQLIYSLLYLFHFILGITNSADCLGYCVMTGLLWPNRAGQYLLLASTNYSGMTIEWKEFQIYVYHLN